MCRAIVNLEVLKSGASGNLLQNHSRLQKNAKQIALQAKSYELSELVLGQDSSFVQVNCVILV
jgi:hypothetical protein